MKVLKFGGTSVVSIKNINLVKDIIVDGEQKIVVLSAMSGTTNALVEIYEHLIKGKISLAEKNIKGAKNMIEVIRSPQSGQI